MQSPQAAPTATHQTTDEQDGSDNASGDSCVICLEHITHPCSAEPCRHRNFDFLCLISWLEEKASCPLCQTPIKSVRYGGADEEEDRWTVYHVPDEQHRSAPLSGNPRSDAASAVSASEPRRRRRIDCSRSDSSSRSSEPALDAAIARRRYVYAHDLYSLHVGSNPISGYRDLTPALVASSPALATKARKWLRRELQVFSYLTSPHNHNHHHPRARSPATSPPNAPRRTPPGARPITSAEYLVEYTIAILKTVDLQASTGAAEDLVAEFVGRPHARLLLHELRAWLRSPFEVLEDFDAAVQYAEPLPGRAGQTSGEQRRGGAGQGGGEGGRLAGHYTACRADCWRPEHGRYGSRHRQR
jgi:hypothetical protein